MPSLSQPIHCRIELSGYLERFSQADGNTLDFSYMTGDRQQVQTTLEGDLPDYAALYGVLNYLYGLGMPLLSVEVQSCTRDESP